MRPGLPLALTAALLLGACSTDRPAKPAAYESAGAIARLEVPPDLTTPSGDDRFSIPGAGAGSQLLSSYEAEHGRTAVGKGGVLPMRPGMRIERDGSERWLVVDETPDKLWPVLKTFWRENGLALALERPDLGIMETEWSQNLAKVPEGFFGRSFNSLHTWPQRDRYRTRLERGADGKSTEIYISERSVVERYNASLSDSVWDLLPPNPGLEAEFLARLMAYLGASREEAKSAVANAQAKPLARLVATAQGQAVEVPEPFDRAWRRVGLALDRVGFTVEDRDRQNGVYYVRYADPEGGESKKGSESLLSRLAFWKSAEAEKGKAGHYRVEVRQDGAVSRVRVLDSQGRPDDSATARRILSLLEGQLK